MKVLITGGGGFIGVNLIETLLEKTESEINILDNFTTSDDGMLEKVVGNSKRVKIFRGDIREVDDIKEAMEDCTSVVNLAAQAEVLHSIEDPYFDMDLNVKGVINILSASVDQGVKKVVHASSNALLGEGKLPLNEESVPQPLSPYGASKLAGEGYLSAWAASYGLNTVALRFSSVYGPKSIQKGSAIAKFIKQIIDGEQVEIWGDGSQTRDLVYVKDIANAIYLCIVTDLPNKYEVIHIGTGEEIRIEEVFNLIYQKFLNRGYEPKPAIHIDWKPGEIRKNWSSIDKAKKILGYEPQDGFEENIEKTIEWFIENYKGNNEAHPVKHARYQP
jgi:UDP-glucose 4-epimerase